MRFNQAHWVSEYSVLEQRLVTENIKYVIRGFRKGVEYYWVYKSKPAHTMLFKQLWQFVNRVLDKEAPFCLYEISNVKGHLVPNNFFNSMGGKHE